MSIWNKIGIGQGETQNLSEKIEKAIIKWKKSTKKWKPAAETLFDLAAEALSQKELTETARVLVELADELVSGTSPSRENKFGVPSYPAQPFIVVSARLAIGQEEIAMNLLDEYEKKIASIENKVKFEYLAYEGWALTLGYKYDLANEKFAESISIANSLHPASYTCDAIVKVANIMKDCGREKDAIHVLDAATDQPDKMIDSLFTTRDGVVSDSSVKHRIIAKSWSDDLKERIYQAKKSIATPIDGTDVFLGYLLLERDIQSFYKILQDQDFSTAITTIKQSILESSQYRFDQVLSLSACAVAIGKQ